MHNMQKMQNMKKMQNVQNMQKMQQMQNVPNIVFRLKIISSFFFDFISQEYIMQPSPIFHYFVTYP